MARDGKAIDGYSTRESASIEDTDEATDAVTVAAGRWVRESTTQRDHARSQVLWMVARARRAARNGCVENACWWRDRAICALWNMN
jgi:hypothetical protein